MTDALTAAATVWPGDTIDLPVEPPGAQWGLVNQVLATPDDTLAGRGIRFQPDAASVGEAFDGYSERYSKPVLRWPNPDPVFFRSFPVLAGDACTPATARDYLTRARGLLDRNLSRLIAREFWAGAIALEHGGSTDWAGHHYLADGHAIDVGDATDADVFDADKATLGLAEAIGALEAYADNAYPGGRIWLHMHPIVGAAMTHSGLVYRQGPRLLTTTRDSVLVLDGGYRLSGDWVPANGQSGYTPRGDTTSAWVYATGTVRIALGTVDAFGANRGDPGMAEMFDFAQNTAAALAERWVTVYFDPVMHAKANVDYSAGLAA